jgi:hypothetical protein
MLARQRDDSCRIAVGRACQALDIAGVEIVTELQPGGGQALGQELANLRGRQGRYLDHVDQTVLRAVPLQIGQQACVLMIGRHQHPCFAGLVLGAREREQGSDGVRWQLIGVVDQHHHQLAGAFEHIESQAEHGVRHARFAVGGQVDIKRVRDLREQGAAGQRGAALERHAAPALACGGLDGLQQRRFATARRPAQHDQLTAELEQVLDQIDALLQG